MPGYDRTGPAGMGPMTGGGRGQCNSANADVSNAFGGGRCFGRGHGRGYGRGRGGWAAAAPETPTMAPQDELAMLKTHASGIQTTLDAIEKRICALESEPQ